MSLKKFSSIPWTWVPSLYLAEGLPYIIVITVVGIMFKNMGISNTDVALYTSWLYLPWVIKPLWSPVVELFKTKRWWIVITQIFMGVSFACIAFTLQTDYFFQYSLAFLWLVAFSSATHDIAADGFYMLGLNSKQQAYYVGIRNTFYRLAVLMGQGLLVILAGVLEMHFDIAIAWSITIGTLAVIFFLFATYHTFALPHPTEDKIKIRKKNLLNEFLDTFVSFFQKEHILTALAFIFFFRLGESQLVKIASLFLLDSPEQGGLGLSTAETGTVYGTVGVVALTLGGILGGILIARNGLKHWIWWMTIAINIPNIVYVYMAFTQPSNLFLISSCVAIEQFGYGLGFTAYTVYLLFFSAGEHKTAHYALCTGFMALGMMLPGMISGWIQEQIGYFYFFIYVLICTIPSFIAVGYIFNQNKIIDIGRNN